MIEVQWGARKTPLKFVHNAYPDDVPVGYEPEVINVAERFLEPGDCVIDAGASVGFHTCLFAKLVGPDGLVLAFEPQLISYRYLLQHVHVLNELGNVGCLRKALWKCHAPELELHSVKDLGYSSFHKYDDTLESETVEGLSLDDLLGDENHPRMIKIDVEGTEAEVLMGAQHILERGVDAVVLELNYGLMGAIGRDDRIMRGWMAELGYQMFMISIGNGAGGLKAPIKVDPNIGIKLVDGHHINVLFSTEEKVRARWTNYEN